MPLDRFVANGNTYDLRGANVVLESYGDNFAELATRTQRLPFADGGFDQLGNGRSLSEIGTIRQQLHLVADTREAMQPLIDALAAMIDWGVGTLYDQPTDTNLAERFCRCRINNVTKSRAYHQHTELHQPITVVWQASEPFWKTPGNGIVWGGGWTWGGGAKWGGGDGTTITGSGTLTLTNSGNAYTQPSISIRPPTSKSVNGVVVRRIVNGLVMDEVRYDGVLAAEDYLFIDTARLAVWLNGVWAYNELFPYKNASWLRLLPGSNSVTVTFGVPTDEAVVRAHFPYRWT